MESTLMVIGNGDIASVLPERDDLLFFASGVSNSQETREAEFRREEELLLRQDYFQHIVYFSSLSIFYNNNPYTRHKRKMEKLIKTFFPMHTIVRLGNITWGTNPHTIINHFKLQKARGEELQIQNTSRYVIEQDEFLHWVNMIPEWSCEMNITGTKMSIKEIVEKYVNS